MFIDRKIKILALVSVCLLALLSIVVYNDRRLNDCLIVANADTLEQTNMLNDYSIDILATGIKVKDAGFEQNELNVDKFTQSKEYLLQFQIEQVAENVPNTTNNVSAANPASTSVSQVASTENSTVTTSTSSSNSLGVFKITAYCSCEKCCGSYANRPNGIVYGASGAQLTPGYSIAVDPSIIPFGTTVYINGRAYVAQDTGGAIGGNRIDIYMASHSEALNWGVQYIEVFR